MLRHGALVVTFLLLAGCAGGPTHGGHGDVAGLALLAGVMNDADQPASVELRLVAPDGSVAWSANLTVEPGRTVERITPLNATGEHRLELRRAGEEAVLGTARVDTRDCPETTHIILALDAQGATREATRECHA